MINAQKGAQGTASSVKPVKGIDVVVMDNSGNIVNRTTNDKGEVTFVGLTPGNYSLTIGDPSKQQKGIRGGSLGGDTDVRSYLVKIDGSAGGPIERDWDVKERKFGTMAKGVARTTTAPSYEEKINFAMGGGNPAPVLTVVIRHRSNIKSN